MGAVTGRPRRELRIYSASVIYFSAFISFRLRSHRTGPVRTSHTSSHNASPAPSAFIASSAIIMASPSSLFSSRLLRNFLSISLLFSIVFLFLTLLSTSLLLFSHHLQLLKLSPLKKQILSAPPSSNNIVLVLDFWERMINIQSALRRLVHLAIDADFTVVEPFIYQSKVSPYFSSPSHFNNHNMVPQTAALYFHVEQLHITTRYIDYHSFLQRVRMLNSSRPTYHVHALVFFDWQSQSAARQPPYWWCDSKLDKFPNATNLFRLVASLHIQRALCLSPNATVAPARFGPWLFTDMFAFIRNGTRFVPQKCADCVSIALANYRKHAFSGFVSSSGVMPFRQKTLPLEVGQIPQRLADRVRNNLLGGHRYVAMQIRTGKAFVLMTKWEQKMKRKGVRVKRHNAFKEWLDVCTKKMVAEARNVVKELGRDAVVYVASDMYNDGWKGGEKCPHEIERALDSAKKFLANELKGIKWFNPEDFGITQDLMGVSGIADAAVCLKADRFMFAVPSNFGRWVHEQRSMIRQRSDTIRVDCVDDRFRAV